jgi:nucleotidyltransferase substrate binding protein (TIGR01987 family)
MNKKIKYALDQYDRAVERLNEGIGSVKDELHRDGVVQRFEFTFELLWKTIKIVLEYKGITDKKYPRDLLKEAFQRGIIDDEKMYLSMLEDRNMLSHMYGKEISDQIYEKISADYGKKLKSAAKEIRKAVDG